MQSLSVFINASEMLCSRNNGELTQEYLTNSQFLDLYQNTDPKTYDETKFLYKSIENKTLEKFYSGDCKERIFQSLFDVIDALINKSKLTSEQLSDTAIFFGSSSMDIAEIKSSRHSSIWLTPLDNITRKIVQRYKLNQLSYSFNTACTSSANAIIYATRFLKAKRIKRAIILGCEFYNELTINGFSSLDLLSKQSLLAFSKNRSGMVLGEGVGALVLSTQTESINDLEILSGYSACDTFSLTASNNDGSHIASVIKKAIALADLNVSDINLIKVHGTASPSSDDAEFNALTSIFKTVPPIMALKPFTGHTLGACAAIETAITHNLLNKNNIPTPEYAKEQKNSLLAFVSSATNINQYQYMLHNYSGFGGNNAAIILKIGKSEDD